LPCEGANNPDPCSRAAAGVIAAQAVRSAGPDRPHRRVRSRDRGRRTALEDGTDPTWNS